MQNLIIPILFSLFLFSCSNSSEKEEEMKDPGSFEGRVDQVCKCMEEKEYSDWQPCYDLNNKYFELYKGDEQFEFTRAVKKCSKKFKKK